MEIHWGIESIRLLIAVLISGLGAGGYVKYRYSKKLNEECEKLKHDLHKDAINAQLLINEHHKITSEIWYLLMIADGAIGGLSGIRRAPTYHEFTEQDFEVLFESRGVAHGQREKVLCMFRSDRNSGIKEWQKYERIMELNHARVALTKARNEIYLKELYLPENMASKGHDLIKLLNELLIAYEYEDVPGGAVEYKEIKALKDKITQQLTVLKNTMKKSLASPSSNGG